MWLFWTWAPLAGRHQPSAICSSEQGCTLPPHPFSWTCESVCAELMSRIWGPGLRGKDSFVFYRDLPVIFQALINLYSHQQDRREVATPQHWIPSSIPLCHLTGETVTARHVSWHVIECGCLVICLEAICIYFSWSVPTMSFTYFLLGHFLKAAPLYYS